MLNFAYNPTSWDDGPIPGGMADRLIRPILPHLDIPHLFTGCPQPGHVNVHYTFRHTYGLDQPPANETSVFVSHGIADKAWRNQRKVQVFDWVFVSGPAWTRRMVLDGYKPDRVCEVGYTKLDPIFNGNIPSTWGERDGRIRVVYAPTHGGGGEKFANSTVPPGTGPRRTTHWDQNLILSLLPADVFDVRLALHPRHRPDKRATLEEYVGADVVIADGGSTIYEAWALDLPVVFPSWLTAHANLQKSTPAQPTFEGQIYSERIGYHADYPAVLPERVEEAAQRGIGQTEQTFIDQILPREYRGVSGRMHAEALSDISRGAKVRHTAEDQTVTYEHVPSGARRTVPKVGDQARRYEQSAKWMRVGEAVNA